MLGASSLFLAHNHPSGDTRPSESDKGLTERLKTGGEILAIKVLDHVIVNSIDDEDYKQNSYFSFAESGLL